MKKQRHLRNVLSTAAPFLWTPGAGPDADALSSYMSEEVYFDWLCSISTFDYLEQELGAFPGIFHSLYIANPGA